MTVAVWMSELGRRADGLRTAHWPILVLSAVALVYLSAVVLMHGRAMSPIDEWVYLDYVSKVLEQGIVREGEPIGPWALDLMSCHGVIPYGSMGSACGVVPVIGDFPYEGISSGAAYQPLQFAIVRVLGDGIAWIFGLDTLVGWRLVGPLWMVAGLVVLYRLARLHGVGNGPIVAVGLVFIASPLAWWSFTFVSTDAPTFFFGALLLLLAVQFARGRRSGWWIVAVAIVGAMFKVILILALGLVLLYLVITLIRRRTDPETAPANATAPRVRSMILFPIGAAVAALAVQFAWMRLGPILALNDDRVDHGISRQLVPSDLIMQATNFLQHSLLYSVDYITEYSFVYLPVVWVLIAGVLGGFMLLRRDSEHFALISATAIAFVIAAPIMSLAFQLLTGSYFSMASRYAMPLMAAGLVLAMLIVKNRVAVWGLVGYSGALIVFGLILAHQVAGNHP